MAKKPAPLTVTIPGDANTDAESARRLHTHGLAGLLYCQSLRPQFSSLFEALGQEQSAFTHAGDVIERMKPRDPLEEMLVVQALGAHARAMHLTSLATQQQTLANVRTVNEYADKASNTYRRLMLALAEYRRPPRGGDSFTAIKQANIAGQQIVNNGETGKNATNEQGFSDEKRQRNAAEPHDDTHDAPEPPQALPPESGGAGVPAGLRSPDEALGAVHRAEDG